MSDLKFYKPKENRPKASLSTFESTLVAEKNVIKLPIARIDEFSYKGQPQPFLIDERELEALVSSIEQQGQLTPVIVRKIGERYQLLSGHKRYTACRQLNYNEIDAVIIDVGSDEKAFDIVCQANVQRREPKPSELCKMYNTYLSMRRNKDEFSNEVTTDTICKLFNVSRKTMYRYANMVKLVDDISFLIDEKKINVSAIEDIVRLSAEQQQAIADYINFDGALSNGKLKRVMRYFEENKNKNCTDVEEALADPLPKKAESNSESPGAESQTQPQTKENSVDLIRQIRNKFSGFADYTDEEICEFVMLLFEMWEAQENE